jgi:hypothetical protein
MNPLSPRYIQQSFFATAVLAAVAGGKLWWRLFVQFLLFRL